MAINQTPKLSKAKGLSLSSWESPTKGPYTTFPSKRQAVGEFYIMSRFDNVIKLTLTVIRNIIISKKGIYTHPNEKVAEEVNQILSYIPGGTNKLFSNLLSSLWAGFSVSEKIWSAQDNLWYISALPLLHPLTFFDWRGTCGITVGKNGKMEFTQYSDKIGGASVKHDANNILYLALHSELEEEVTGASLLQSARKAWYSKNYIQDFANTYSQKLAMPTPLFFCPIEELEDPISGQVSSIASILTNFWDWLEPGQALAIPVQNPEAINMELVEVNGSGEFFEWILKYYDSQLFLSLLTPNLLVENPTNSSRAQAETNLDVFHEVLNGLRDEIKAVIEEQVIRDILLYNYGEIEAGEWLFEPLNDDDLSELSTIYTNIASGMKSISEIEDIKQFDVDIQKMKDKFNKLV